MYQTDLIFVAQTDLIFVARPSAILLFASSAGCRAAGKNNQANDLTFRSHMPWTELAA